MDQDGIGRPFEAPQTDLALSKKMDVSLVQAIWKSLLRPGHGEAELAGSTLLR